MNKVAVAGTIILVGISSMMVGLWTGMSITKDKTRISNSLVTPSITPSNLYTQDEIDNVTETEDLLERCGDIPDIKEMPAISSGRMYKVEAKWSPDCKYVLWSNQTIPFVGGYLGGDLPTPTGYLSKPNEGVFLYNSCSKKSIRIYKPISDKTISKLKWEDRNTANYFIDDELVTYYVNNDK